MDAHGVARPQRSLKESDDQRLADFSVGALHGGVGGDGETAGDAQRSAFDRSLDDEIAVAAHLTNESSTERQDRLGPRRRTLCG